jgi:L-ascorbate metabolism protein UlaG (beta-lactamase superfamily)
VSEFSITRVVNACVLLEFGEYAVLTDPYFEPRWHVRVKERIGLTADRLPKLASILGGHRVMDHWQPGSLTGYPFKAATSVYVAAPSMARSARAAGFERIEVLAWGETRELAPDLTVYVARAQTSAGMRVNSYVLSDGDLRVFVGTEARDLMPLREHRERNGPVDVALLPIDGSALAGHRLVMTPRDAIEACRILGAQTLVPIHYALKPVPLLLQTPGTLKELLVLGRNARDLAVVPLEPGQRWSWSVGSHASAETRRATP